MDKTKEIKQMIGANLRKIREYRGLTQQELGLKLNYKPDQAQNRLWQYESSQRTPSLRTLGKLADILNVPIHTFFLKSFDVMTEIRIVQLEAFIRDRLQIYGGGALNGIEQIIRAAFGLSTRESSLPEELQGPKESQAEKKKATG